jgi:hypothetical protein
MLLLLLFVSGYLLLLLLLPALSRFPVVVVVSITLIR